MVSSITKKEAPTQSQSKEVARDERLIELGGKRSRTERIGDGGTVESPTKKRKPYRSAQENLFASEPELSDPPKHPVKSTPTSPTVVPFVPTPVTRPDFVKKYKVENMPGAEVYYQADWIDSKTATRWRDELESLPEWYRPFLKVYGKTIQQSRHIAAFSREPGLELKYSGHPVEMHAPFPQLLAEIAARLSSDDCLGSSVQFNHCMLNRYEDGNIYIGKHSDNVENKVIVTVSLGSPRTWIMEKRRPRKGTKAAAALEASGDAATAPVRKKWTLGNGSLLVMQGDTQRQWTHEIPKEAKIKESRISITFRQLVYD